jgi:hypothetical protein
MGVWIIDGWFGNVLLLPTVFSIPKTLALIFFSKKQNKKGLRMVSKVEC